MADPRFKCQVSAAAAQSKARAFGQAVGKIGDLNVMNSVGGGQVGAGLRTLASVSNSIRTGCGALPSSIGDSLATGTEWVLGHVGLTSTTLSAVQGLNPQVANQAQAQAQQIFQQVKAGHFKISDIPSSMQDLQNLERLARNIYTPPTGNTMINETVDCTTTPYAMQLIQLAPKHKFMFVVEIGFNTGYEELNNGTDVVALVVKKSTRPSTKFISEDVNYYNFRSKVITKTEHEDMKMTFHDDSLDAALLFVNNYRRAMSPVASMDDDTISFTERGMDFGQSLVGDAPIGSQIPANLYSASRGPLANDNITVLEYITLYQIFNAGTEVNQFVFLNPRITQIDLDDVDMAVGNEGNEVSFSFNYDSVTLTTVPMAALTDDNNGIFPGQDGASYPLRNNTDIAKANVAHAALPQPPTPDLCKPPADQNTGIKSYIPTV